MFNFQRRLLFRGIYIIDEGRTQIIQFKDNQNDYNSVVTLNISANLLYNF